MREVYRITIYEGITAEAKSQHMADKRGLGWAGV